MSEDPEELKIENLDEFNFDNLNNGDERIIEGFQMFVDKDQYTMTDFFDNPWKIIDRNLFAVNWYKQTNTKLKASGYHLNVVYKKPVRENNNVHAGIALEYNIYYQDNGEIYETIGTQAYFSIFKVIDRISLDRINQYTKKSNFDIISRFLELEETGINEIKIIKSLGLAKNLEPENQYVLQYDRETESFIVYFRLSTRHCVHLLLDTGFLKVETLDSLQGLIATAICIATENNVVLSPRLLLEGNRDKQFWIQQFREYIDHINNAADKYLQAYWFYYVVFAFYQNKSLKVRNKMLPYLYKIPKEVLDFSYSNVTEFLTEHDVLREFPDLYWPDKEAHFRELWEISVEKSGKTKPISLEERLFDESEKWKEFDEMNW